MSSNFDLLVPIRDCISDLQRELDDLEWECLEDPRIEYLISQIAYYKQLEKDGELYIPSF